MAILEDDQSDKELLLAAIEAAATSRPSEAPDRLVDYLHSTDEDVAEAARSALMRANGLIGMDSDDDAEEEEQDDRDRRLPCRGESSPVTSVPRPTSQVPEEDEHRSDGCARVAAAGDDSTAREWKALRES